VLNLTVCAGYWAEVDAVVGACKDFATDTAKDGLLHLTMFYAARDAAKARTAHTGNSWEMPQQWTRLHQAALAGLAGREAVLVASGADVNARDKLGHTALHWASQRGHTAANLHRPAQHLLTTHPAGTILPQRQAVPHADKIRHILARRLGEDRMRRLKLLDPSAPHDRQPIRQRQRLGLIMRDENRCKTKPRMQFVQLATHLLAQLRVQITERLIEQHQIRPRHQPARQRHTLLLPAGELRRITIQQGLALDQPDNLVHPACRQTLTNLTDS
jgi:hypothetical protein